MSTILLRIGLGLLTVILIVSSVGFAYRAWRQHELADRLAIRSPNGIDEGRFVRLGGIEQWIRIRGESRDNPVLLVLHGGPAMSYMAFSPLFQAWEKDFTVVQWDRRGVGKTFGRNGADGSGPMTLDRIAEDGVELSQYLKSHLHKDKIILMGHSMGSMIGLTMAKRRPDLFYVYVGTDQIVDMAQNEAVSYRLLLEKLEKNGNPRAVEKLKTIGPPPFKTSMDWGTKEILVDNADAAYRDVARAKIWPGIVFTPDYSIMDTIDFLRGNRFCSDALFDQWMAFDARKLGPDFSVPVVILQGGSDIMVPTALVEAYFASIHAPHKELVVFRGAGHLPMFTEPDAFLKELVARVRPLALHSSG